MTKYVEVNDFISHITRVIKFNKIYENLYRVGLNKEQKKSVLPLEFFSAEKWVLLNLLTKVINWCMKFRHFTQ